MECCNACRNTLRQVSPLAYGKPEAWGESRDLSEIPQPLSEEAECEHTRVALEHPC